MESFFSRYRNALVLLLVLVLQLLALAVQAKRPAKDAGDPEAVSLIRYAVVTIVTPPEKVLHNTGLWFRNLWFGYIDLVDTRRDNAALKDEIERLRLEQASVVEDAKQGQRLQQLLRFKEHYIYRTVPAQVIGTAGTDQSGIVYIDKGSDDGLKQDMPVMTADGIVGRLKDVFPSTSQLMLISDAASGVGVMLQSTRTRGVLKGAPFGQVQMINVSPDNRIKPGEKIITSGGDQIFPRGMPVGVVDRAVPDPDHDPLLDVVVTPAANLSRLEEVLVITGLGDLPSSQEAKDLAESEAEGEAAQKRASDILSERLPSRIDANAPADTNPDANVDSTGNVVRPLAPPKPLHADGYTPGATPPASALTPGERIVPVKNGVEELPPAKAQEARSAEASPTGASPRTATSPAAAAGTAIPRTVNPGSANPGSAAISPAAPRKPAESPKPVGGKPVAVDANGVARPAPAARTSTTGEASTAAVPRAARPSGTTAPGAAVSGAGSSASTPGSAPRPSTAAAPRPAAVPPTRSATPASSAAGPGAGGLSIEPKTRIIDDGPVTRPARPSTGAAPKTVTPPPASGAPTSLTATPATAKPATPVKKGPILVPDDGSRPPPAVRPKKPAETQPAAPQGRGAA